VVRRIVYRESCKDFDSEDELKQYIEVGWNRVFGKYVWNVDGLVGCLYVSTDSCASLHVDLWKITVHGQLPELFKAGVCSGGTIQLIPSGN
jgi:hypothetical protein